MTAEELSDKRRLAGKKQYELANEIGTKQQRISEWENGKPISKYFKRKLREVLK